MKIKTITADSVEELDGAVNVWIEKGWEVFGEMHIYREVRGHAVHGYDVWENKFSQRIKKESIVKDLY